MEKTVKRGRGRPKGSKNKAKIAPIDEKVEDKVDEKVDNENECQGCDQSCCGSSSDPIETEDNEETDEDEEGTFN